MQRLTLTEITQQLKGTPNDPAVFDELLSCLDEIKRPDAVPDKIANELKPYQKQLFAAIRRLPLEKQKQAVAKIFDESKPDKKNLTTALGKVFCQGNSSVEKPQTQLGSIYQECKTVGTKHDVVNFFKAIRDRHLALVEQYLAIPDFNPNVFDENGNTPLIIAVFSGGHLDIVKALLAKVDVNLPRKEDGLTAFYLAAQKNQLEVMRLLLAAGANVNQEKEEGTTALYTASQFGHVKVVELLLANGADISKKFRWYTPLNVASYSGHTEIVNCLLDATLTWLQQAQVADVTEEMAKKLKPYKKQLFAAIRKLPLEKQKQAVAKIFDETKPDKKNLTTALGEVFCQGNSSVEKLQSQLGSIYQECKAAGLFEKAAQVAVSKDDVVGFFKAIEEGDLALVEQYLAVPGFDLNVCNEHCFIPLPLVWAAYHGRFNIVNAFLTKNVDVSQAMENGATALFAAAEKGHEDVAKLLLENGAIAIVNQALNNGSTPLGIASKKGHAAVAKLLLVNGANVNQANNQHVMPLYVASQNGHVAVVKLLLENGADISETFNGWLPLTVASAEVHTEIVNCLLDATLTWLLQAQVADVTDEIAKGLKEFKKQLFAAIRKLPLEKQKQVVAQIFDESKPDKKNLTTVLGKVFCQGNSSVEKPQSQLGSIYQECKAAGLFETAAQVGVSKDDVVGFFRAIKQGDLALVEQYLAVPGFDLNIFNENGFTPLIQAAYHGRFNIVNVFLTKNVNVSQVLENGGTALYVAAQNGHEDVAKLLLERGAIAIVNQALKDGSTPLGIASKKGHVAVAKLLLVSGAMVNQAAGNGATPLSVAVHGGHAVVVKLLLENGADTSKSFNNGYLPLAVASAKGHTEIVNSLLDATVTWLLQAQVADVTDEIAKGLKEFKKQLFESIKKLPDEDQKKQIILQIFDNSAEDRKNRTTAFGKVFCQGNSSIHKSKSQLGSIFDECVNLKLVTRPEGSGFLAGLSLFKKADKKTDVDAPDIDAEIDALAPNAVHDSITNDRL